MIPSRRASVRHPLPHARSVLIAAVMGAFGILVACEAAEQVSTDTFS
jgi:hypothetical protein